uniref:Uncharacterized protein n=1 Tax=Proboscia inermis TaxID=420281 RepID=A0A7S0C0U4_9STRA
MEVQTSRIKKREDPRKAGVAIAWFHQVFQELQPHVMKKNVGCFAQITGQPLHDGPSPLASINVYGDADRIQNLKSIKRKFDPMSIFSAVESGMTCAHNIHQD